MLKEARKLKRYLTALKLDAELAIENCESQIGGGSLPLESLASYAVTIKPNKITTAELENRMRFLSVPIIPRVQDDKIYLDVRTLCMDSFKAFEQLTDIM